MTILYKCCINITQLLVLILKKCMIFNSFLYMPFIKLMVKITNTYLIIGLLFLVNNCGIYKPVDARKVSPNAKDRAEKNIQTGKGFKVFDTNRNKAGGVFQFASSNPMWRATISLLEFTPLSNVDYSGGIIITDWFNDDVSNQAIKITVKFLSNEIRSDAIKVIVYKRICDDQNNCKTNKLDTILEKEIKVAILKEAALIEENEKIKNPDFKYPKIPEKN
jgi:hypothetical protein